MQFGSLMSSVFAGIIGTYTLLTLALWAHRIGLPRLDFARAMANLTYDESIKGEVPYRAGVAVIYMNGIFFALLYSFAVGALLPLTPLLNGLLWGGILFVVSGVFFVPQFLREGYFLSGVHKNAWATSLIVHGAWGMVVGWLAPVFG